MVTKTAYFNLKYAEEQEAAMTTSTIQQVSELCQRDEHRPPKRHSLIWYFDDGGRECSPTCWSKVTHRCPVGLRCGDCIVYSYTQSKYDEASLQRQWNNLLLLGLSIFMPAVLSVPRQWNLFQLCVAIAGPSRFSIPWQTDSEANREWYNIYYRVTHNTEQHEHMLKKPCWVSFSKASVTWEATR